MIQSIRRLTLLAVAVLVLGLAARVEWSVVGLDDLWTAIAGPADLGPVDFKTVLRRTTPNDALACPPGFCPMAKSDLDAPVFLVDAAQLRDALEKTALSDGEVEKVFTSPHDGAERYVARSRLMRFPDTVNVQVIDLAPQRSSLALYSRSQLGRSDFGANKARLERWLQALQQTLPYAKP
jgi:uncharacterized protein (DUF1499 family)